MEESEAHGLLELVVAVDLDVRALPVVVEVLALVLEQAVEPRAPRGRERGVGLVADRDHRALAGPPVGHVLGQRQRLTVADLGADRHPREVVEALVLGDRALRPLDLVIHPRRHPQRALPRAVHQDGAQLVGAMRLRDQRRGQDRGRPRVLAARGHVLVGHDLRLQDDPRLAVERLDLVADRGHRAVHEGHQAYRAHLDLAPGRRAPVDLAAQHPGAQVEGAAVRDQRAVAHVEGLVVDQQADELAVGDVDDGLALLRIAVAGLRIGQRAHLVEGVQVSPRHPVGLALVEVGPQPDVAVGEREDRFGLGEHAEVELLLGHRPRRDGEVRLGDHSSSARSSTTTEAPWASSASRWPARSTPTT